MMRNLERYIEFIEKVKSNENNRMSEIIPNEQNYMRE